MRIWTAFRVFFKTLFDTECHLAVQRLLDGPVKPADDTSTASGATSSKASRPSAKVVTDKPKRNDAITLLSALQREARFVDLVKEPLGGYSDAQIGAAARDVLRDCGMVLDRFFGIRAAVELEEGSSIEVPVGFDAGQFQLKGAVTGEPPFHGKLVHHGWQAAKAELPRWTGKSTSQMIVAPIEVEVGSSKGLNE